MRSTPSCGTTLRMRGSACRNSCDAQPSYWRRDNDWRKVPNRAHQDQTNPIVSTEAGERFHECQRPLSVAERHGPRHLDQLRSRTEFDS
jgi:hypothetical protein